MGLIITNIQQIFSSTVVKEELLCIFFKSLIARYNVCLIEKMPRFPDLQYVVYDSNLLSSYQAY